MTIFDFFKILFLGFSAEIRGHNYLYSGLSEDIHFVGFRLSFHAFSPLHIVLSKCFNHPHPYVGITTVISDIQCMQGADGVIYSTRQKKCVRKVSNGREITFTRRA